MKPKGATVCISKTEALSLTSPVLISYLTHLYQTRNCHINVDVDEVEQIYSCVNQAKVKKVSSEFKEFAHILITQNGLNPPNNAPEALHFYMYFL